MGDNLYNFSFLGNVAFSNITSCIQSALKPVCFDFTNFFPHCAFSFSFYCCSLSILYILSKLLPLFSPLSDSLSYSLNQCRNLWAPACLVGGEKTAASKHKILSTEKKKHIVRMALCHILQLGID